MSPLPLPEIDRLREQNRILKEALIQANYDLRRQLYHTKVSEEKDNLSIAIGRITGVLEKTEAK